VSHESAALDERLQKGKTASTYRGCSAYCCQQASTPTEIREQPVRVTEDGVPIQELIETIKQAIKTANVSSADPDRDLRVGSVQLTLNAVATRSLGGGLDFRIPFIGMQVKLGSKLTKQDTHRIDISLVPPDLKGRPELRDGDLGSVFVDAINTIRAAVASAATGDDPFILTESSVNISFAVTAEGTISLGVDGGLTNEVTHTLTLGLVPA
jgi:Trypsin-co-occurring domain 2